MRKIVFILFVFLLFCKVGSAQQDYTADVQYFKPAHNMQIWALATINESTVWFAGKHGVWGYTEDAGKTWHVDSIKVDTLYPQFRSISVLNDSTVLLFSIASPAYLFKTTNKGKTWKVVYKNTDKDIFFDSMIFYTAKDGIALGDPIDSCFQIIKTNDGGESWKQVDCAEIPKAQQDEDCFAASNTCIDVFSNNVWFVSGGAHSRVFHSTDMGNHFKTFNSPLPQGEKMTGIFSIDFFNKTTGVIAGGNYGKADNSILSMALTRDGGKTWGPIKSNKAVFGACVQFRTADEIFVAGNNGTYRYNIGSGKTIEVKDKSGARLLFNTLRFSPSKKAMWMANTRGDIALVSLK